MKENKIHILWQLAKREFKFYGKSPIYLFCMLIAPIISITFFLSIMHEGLPKDLPIAVVDMDNTANSRKLVRLLGTFEQTHVEFSTGSFSDARQEMQKGKIYGIFHIPKDFAKEAASGKQPKLSFYTNGAYLIPSSLLFKDMKSISELAGGSVGLQTGLARGYTEDQIQAQLQPIRIDTHPLGNPWLNYSVYLNNTIVPGILQLMIFFVTVFSIGAEIKFDTANEWLKMGNGSLTLSLIGKLWPQTVVFTLISFLYAAIFYGYSAFPLNSGWLPMLSAFFLLVISSQALGIFMIGMVPILRLALGAASLIGILAFSIVGFSFPVLAMSPDLQAISNIFPLRHYFLIYIDQALNGRSMIYSWTEYIWLLGFLILPFLIGKNLKRALLSFKYIP